jgi:KaiC/GvpD/RAD55 family RecA-like ATPase
VTASVWAALVNGQPYFMADTSAYVREPDFAVVYLFGDKFAMKLAELSPGQLIHEIRYLVEKHDLKLLIIDSLNGFLNAMPGEQFLAMQLHELLAFLSQKGVATLMTVAQHGFVGTNIDTPVDVSYLADTVLLFRYFEAAGEVRQALSVIKKRSGEHERTILHIAFRRGFDERHGRQLLRHSKAFAKWPLPLG